MTSTTELTFGQRLRLERERRRIALESIAANTKISAALFAGLERDDVSRWPVGIFRRAFIRAYAEAIGLDAEATTREFLARFPDPLEIDAIGDSAGTTAAPSPIPRGGLRLLLAECDQPLIGQRFLRSTRRRAAAVGFDVGAVAAISLLVSVTVGAFWMPLALSTLGYYVIAILVLGATPGIRWYGSDEVARFTAMARLPGMQQASGADSAHHDLHALTHSRIG